MLQTHSTLETKQSRLIKAHFHYLPFITNQSQLIGGKKGEIKAKVPPGLSILHELEMERKGGEIKGVVGTGRSEIYCQTLSNVHVLRKGRKKTKVGLK